MFFNRDEYISKNPYLAGKDCPFCKLEEDEKALFLYKTKYWEVRFNKFPYYWYKQNLLAFPIEHKANTTDLTDEEILDFKNIELYMKNYFWEKNYFSFIRHGKWWRSVEHLHYHYLEWIFMHSPNGEKLFEVITK